MKRASLFPVREMDALPKTLSRGCSEGKCEWWTEGLEQKSPAADLITMCLWRDSDRGQGKSLALRNILFVVKLCHFFQLGHMQRRVADDTSKHNDSALNLQSAEKKRFSHLQRSLLMNHQRRGTRRGSQEGRRGRAANANAGRFCSAGRCEATHCSLCLHADVILFRQKQQQRRRDRVRVPVRPVSTQCCLASEQGILFFSYFVSFFFDVFQCRNWKRTIEMALLIFNSTQKLIHQLQASSQYAVRMRDQLAGDLRWS